MAADRNGVVGVLLVALIGVLSLGRAASADWPMLHGNAKHDGFVDAELKGPYRLVWATAFAGERIGSAVEPIVADGRVYIATHAGGVYALDAVSGRPVWRFLASGAFLHSPAAMDGRVYAGCVDGRVYGLDARSGRILWRSEVVVGGYSASPVVAGGRVLIGSRWGEFLALDAVGGQVRWRSSLGVPIRQTSAVFGTRVFVMAEDLRVRCFSLDDGKLLWTSKPLAGQTARDYYPIVIESGGRGYVIVRTNPLLNMGQRIGRDRTLLARNAGADDSDWKKLDTWLKSEAARGNADLYAKEQRAVSEYLRANCDAETFFVLDAETGRETQTAPVMWVGGCQGVGAMPAKTRDGRLLVFYRSAYGNWNHGVAPMVGLGLLDVAKNQVEPLFHRQGRQPPWNCFWGTADESQNFVVVGETVLIVHQGTLSGFNLKTNDLHAIHGERDRYGGFRNPAWARNEWHGPGRGGVAVVGNRIYWQTGSRLLCVVMGEGGQAAGETLIEGEKVATIRAAAVPGRTAGELREELARVMEEAISTEWAPLFADPGLSGRVFLFDESRSLFEAAAWAWGSLPEELRARLKARLAGEYASRPPYAVQGSYALNVGKPREWFDVPIGFRARLGGDARPHVFGGVYAAWLYGERCGEKDRVLASWPAIKASFADFAKSGWRLDATKGHLYANRYLASLLACEKLGMQAGDPATAEQARDLAWMTSESLIAWWQAAGQRAAIGTFDGSSELDRFITAGDPVSFRVAPHRHKLALFMDLCPEVAAIVRAKAPGAFDKIWEGFTTLYRTWPLQGEERQVHFGENFVDAPDLAASAFMAMALLKEADGQALAGEIDVPFCRADLCHAMKLAVALDRMRRGAR